MSTLSDKRAHLAATLTAASIPTIDHAPERFNPPGAALTPSAVYVKPAERYGSYEVRLDVLLTVALGANETESNLLDHMVCQAIDALETERTWTVETVAQPYALAVNNATYFATRMTVVCETTIDNPGTKPEEEDTHG